MAIVRLDKVKAKNAGHLFSIKHTSPIKNGSVWVATGLASGEREVFNIAPVTGSYGDGNMDGFDPIVLHASVEYMWESNKPKLDQFELAADEVGRAYLLEEGDIVTITSDMFDSVPDDTNKYVVPSLANPGKLKASPNGKESFTDGTNNEERTHKLIFKFVEQTTLGADNSTAYTLLVVKNHI